MVSTTFRRSDELSTHVRRFAELPGDGYVKTSTVQTLVDRSRTTIWRMVEEGLFPRPYHLGPNGLTNERNPSPGHRLVGFKVREVREALGMSSEG